MKSALEPAPERKKRTTWRECLAAHWDVLAAADFFTVEVWTPRGLTRFTVLVLIHLASRRVQIAGISAEPDGPWVTQLMRNATDAEDGFLRHIRVLIHDRDLADAQSSIRRRRRVASSLPACTRSRARGVLVFGGGGPPRRCVCHDRGPVRICGPCVSRGAQAGGVRPLPPPATRRLPSVAHRTDR